MDDTFLFIFRVLLVQILRENINLKKFKKVFNYFYYFFFLSPASYLYVSITNDYKRTDYPGKEISGLVQRRWDKNFANNISIVVGDEWYAGKSILSS